MLLRSPKVGDTMADGEVPQKGTRKDSSDELHEYEVVICGGRRLAASRDQ